MSVFTGAVHIPGCILVTCIGIVGKVAINNIECAFNQQINAIAPDTKKCDTKYIAYAIQSQQHRLQDIANAAVVPILNKTQFSDIEISLPPLEEQRRIAATLNKVSDLIAKRRAQLDKLDLLVKARFVEMFGAEEERKTLSDICSIITDGTHQPPKFVTEGIPFLFVSNVVSNVITYETEKYISQETYNELIKRTPIEPGDILLSTVGSYGHPAIVKDKKKFLFQRHIAYLKPNHEMVYVPLKFCVGINNKKRRCGNGGQADQRRVLPAVRQKGGLCNLFGHRRRHRRGKCHLDPLSLHGCSQVLYLQQKVLLRFCGSGW